MSKICPSCGKKHMAAEVCPYCNTKIQEIDLEYVQLSEQTINSSEKFELKEIHPVALLLIFIVIGSLIVGTIFDLMNTNIGSNRGNIIFYIISFGIGYICGEHAASKWAPKINGSKTWAFIIPFFTNLIGLFCYWIYYLYKRNKMNMA